MNSAKADLIFFIRQWYAEKLMEHPTNPLPKDEAIVMAVLVPLDEVVEAFHRAIIKESLEDMEYNSVNHQKLTASLLSILQSRSSQ